MSLSTRMAFGKELIEIAKTNQQFVICSADTKACGLEEFGKLFSGREFKFGIAEQNMMNAAAGLASCGKKVFVATFAVFATMRACEQVRTFICYPKLNVTIIGTHTGLQVGSDGATHMAIEDVSIMRAFPNITILQPSDAVSAQKMAHIAVDFNGPLYIRLHRNPSPDIHNSSTYHIELGKANVIRDYGNDVTFIVSGIMLGKVLEAVEKLLKLNIRAKVLEIHTIKPIDKEAVIKAAQETRAIITVEDHTIMGGLGSAVSEILSEQCPVWMKRIGIQDVFGESGDSEKLYIKHKMAVDDMVKAAIEIINKK
ncbi:MAG TPA: transketolase C-terminal domain-containing protein [Bacillota bacterium]|nr:transketolase C-terminal domain-containing protein [Bacillota bacterium]